MALHIAPKVVIVFEDLVPNPGPETIKLAKYILAEVIEEHALGEIGGIVHGGAAAHVFANPTYNAPGLNDAQNASLRFNAQQLLDSGLPIMVFVREMPQPNATSIVFCRYLWVFFTEHDHEIRLTFPHL